jgi:PAS domain S-box-containing protein
VQAQELTREQLKQEFREQELLELRTRNAALELSHAESEQVRQALQETEARYRALVEHCPDAILVTGDDKCIYVNPAGVRLFGAASPSELWAKNILDLIHPNDRSAFAERMSRMEEHGGANPLLEENILRLDGKTVPVEAVAARITYQGEPAIQLLIRDISQRKQAETVTKRLAAIVESSDDAIVAKTLDGTILSWNAGAEGIYGYSAAEVVGRSISLLVPPDRPDELPQILAKLARGERIAHYQTQRVRKDGRRIHISLTISPLMDSEGKIVGASMIARDITKQKQVEEELQRAKAAVEDSWP